MTKYFLYEPSQCAVFTSSLTKICLPVVKDCGVGDTFIVKCGEEFNCIDCCGGKIPYFLPYYEGDSFMVQTKIFDKYNFDRKNPDHGIGEWIQVYLEDADGNEISSFGVLDAGYVGWNGKNSYQVYKFLLSDLPGCFKIKFKVYKIVNGEPVLDYELCSQWFMAINACSNTVIIEGKHNGFDCEGNYYDLPETYFGDEPFKYSNKLRVPISIEKITPEVTETVKNNIIVNRTINYRQEYRFEAIPLYMLQYLEDRVFSGDVYIDGTFKNIQSGVNEPIEGICNYNLSKYITSYCENKKC